MFRPSSAQYPSRYPLVTPPEPRATLQTHVELQSERLCFTTPVG
jgi:hypothetical protein